MLVHSLIVIVFALSTCPLASGTLRAADDGLITVADTVQKSIFNINIILLTLFTFALHIFLFALLSI